MDGTFLEIDLDEDILDTSANTKDNSKKTFEIDYGDILEKTPDKEIELLEGFKPVNLGLDVEHYKNEIIKRIKDLSDKEQEEILKNAEFHLEKFKILKSQKKLEDIELPENEELKEFLHLITGEEITNQSINDDLLSSKIIEKVEFYIRTNSIQIKELQNDISVLKDADILRKYNDVLKIYNNRLSTLYKVKEKEKKNFISNLFNIIKLGVKTILVFFIILTVVVQAGKINTVQSEEITESKVENVIINQSSEISSGVPFKTYIPQYDLLEEVYNKTVGKAYDFGLGVKDFVVDLIDK